MYANAGILAAGLTGTGAANAAVGQVMFDVQNSTYSWVVPVGVTSISAVVVGRGGASRSFASGESGFTTGGLGGNLRYATIAVTPLETLTIGIDVNGSTISRAGAPLLNAWSQGTPGTQPGAGEGFGFNGGIGTAAYWEEPENNITGGGAGGYTSAGGNSTSSNGRGGGGVSLLGGSVGGLGGAAPAFTGGDYGGGGGKGSTGGKGGVRIIWGPGRAYPATNTADQTPVDLGYNAFRTHIAALATDGVANWSTNLAFYPDKASAYRIMTAAPTSNLYGTSWGAAFALNAGSFCRVIQHGLPSEAVFLAQIAAGREVFVRTAPVSNRVVNSLNRNGYVSDQGGAEPETSATFCTSIIYWDGVQAQQMNPSTGSGPTPYTW